MSVNNEEQRTYKEEIVRTLTQMAIDNWGIVLEILGKETYEKYLKQLNGKELSIPIKREITVFQLKQLLYLDINDIIMIHDRLIAEFGGVPGIRDSDILTSVFDRVRHSQVYGEDTLPTLFHKGAYLFKEIVQQHPFVDGQKRTGLTSMFVFLGLNGYFMWSRDIEKELHIAVETAKGNVRIAELMSWLDDIVEITSPDLEKVLVHARKVDPNISNPLCPDCSKETIVKGRSMVCKECNTIMSVSQILFTTSKAGIKEEVRIVVYCEPNLDGLNEKKTINNNVDN